MGLLEDEEDAGPKDADEDGDRGAQFHPLARSGVGAVICVRGREKGLPHNRVGEKGKMPELHVDVCFMGEEKNWHNTITVEYEDDDGHGWVSEKCDRLRQESLSRS